MPGRSPLADTGDVGEAGEQTVHQRPAAIAGARMDHQAGRLVDHDDGVVGVHHREVDAGVRLRWFDHRDRRRVDPHEGTRAHPVLAAGDRDPVDAHSPGGDQRRRRRPAHVDQQRHHPVEPFAVERRRDRLDHPLGPAVLVAHWCTRTRA